jgi:hypothetical protein
MASQTAKSVRLEIITQLRMQTNINSRQTFRKQGYAMMSEYSALHDEHSCNKPWKHTIQAVSG